MRAEPKIVSFLGYSNTGKTGFVEAALRACAERGIPAAAVKKSRHPADLRPEAKDSERFFRAGAAPSIYLDEDSMLVLSPRPPELDLSRLAELCPGAEIILCEGLEIEGAALVLVAGAAAAESELKRPLADADALLGGGPALAAAAAAAALPRFAPEEADAFLDWVLAR